MPSKINVTMAPKDGDTNDKDNSDEEKKFDPAVNGGGDANNNNNNNTSPIKSMALEQARNAYASLDAPSALLDTVGVAAGDEDEDDEDDDAVPVEKLKIDPSTSSDDVDTSPTTASMSASRSRQKKSNLSDDESDGNEKNQDEQLTKSESTGPTVLEFQELIADCDFIEVDDQEMWPKDILATMAQLIPCRVTENDNKGVYRHLEIGFIGLCCRWCGGNPPRGRYFPNQMSNVGRQDTHDAMFKHIVDNCPHCPPQISMSIMVLQKQGKKKPGKPGKRVYDSRLQLAEILWERIHNSQPDESEDFLLHPENRGIEYSPEEKKATMASVKPKARKSIAASKEEKSKRTSSSRFREYDPGELISTTSAGNDGDGGDGRSRRSGRKRKKVDYSATEEAAPAKKPREIDPIQIFIRPTLKCKMDHYVEEYGHWEHNPPFPFKITWPTKKEEITQETKQETDAGQVVDLTEEVAVKAETAGPVVLGDGQSDSEQSAIITEPIVEVPELTPEQQAANAGFEERAIVENINFVEDPSQVESYGVSPEELPGIPSPVPIPELPNTGMCTWSFDGKKRVLIADFTCQAKESSFTMHPEDSKFFFQMMEKDDITLISRGLLNYSKLQPQLWDMEYMSDRLKGDFHHKFRRFDRVVDEETGHETFKEVDKMYSMRVEDYVRYTSMRSGYLADLKRAPPDEPVVEPQFTFLDATDKEHTISVGKTALYMIDVDMKRLMPWMYDNFQESFNVPSVLPGGSHCMMNSVTPEARPFMGPNLYITPPASFTHFHQDGHGTVDSGHLVISGYNEVIMLRRLPERHKKHALWILTGKRPNKTWWDGLYAEPHGDNLGEKPAWPTVEMISDCESMGYCPTVCILEPGDLIHINKGRLHAFRKMSTNQLPPTDCHAELRSDLIVKNGLSGEHACVSVAWDWMYRGVTAGGINREVCTTLEATILNQKNGVVSLAIPELSLLHMAKEAVAPLPSKPFGSGSFLHSLPHCVEVANSLSLSKKAGNNVYDASPQDICRGILPALRHVVQGHLSSLSSATDSRKRDTRRGERLNVSKMPDTQPNPALHPVDPLGNTGFACRLCSKELSNVYYHCDGCENLLSKDYNICKDCYSDKRFLINEQMHPTNPKKHSTLNHTGGNTFNRIDRCPCKNGPRCNDCNYCLGCSCRCHSWFTMKVRLINEDAEKNLLQKVEEVAGVPLTAIDSQPALNWLLPVEGSPASFDVETMTTLANERFADAKYGPRSV